MSEGRVQRRERVATEIIDIFNEFKSAWDKLPVFVEKWSYLRREFIYLKKGESIGGCTTQDEWAMKYTGKSASALTNLVWRKGQKALGAGTQIKGPTRKELADKVLKLEHANDELKSKLSVVLDASVPVLGKSASISPPKVLQERMIHVKVPRREVLQEDIILEVPRREVLQEDIILEDPRPEGVLSMSTNSTLVRNPNDPVEKWKDKYQGLKNILLDLCRRYMRDNVMSMDDWYDLEDRVMKL